MVAPSSEAGRGRDASTPMEVPAPGWRDIAARTLAEAKADGLVLLAATIVLSATSGSIAISATTGEANQKNARCKRNEPSTMETGRMSAA